MIASWFMARSCLVSSSIDRCMPPNSYEKRGHACRARKAPLHGAAGENGTSRPSFLRNVAAARGCNVLHKNSRRGYACVKCLSCGCWDYCDFQLLCSPKIPDDRRFAMRLLVSQFRCILTKYTHGTDGTAYIYVQLSIFKQ